MSSFSLTFSAAIFSSIGLMSNAGVIEITLSFVTSIFLADIADIINDIHNDNFQTDFAKLDTNNMFIDTDKNGEFKNFFM